VVRLMRYDVIQKSRSDVYARQSTSADYVISAEWCFTD